MTDSRESFDQTPAASAENKEPATVQVLLTSGEGVRIEWKDGHKSEYAFDYLRGRCPCATCRDQQPPAAGKTLLPMFKERVRAVAAQAVGNYAVQLSFSDGHTTGIYTFEYFREICPCPRCRAKSGKGME